MQGSSTNGTNGANSSLLHFTDRRAAGRRLARELARLQHDRPVVVAIARGGVPIGDEVARALEAPLDVCVVRKLGAPWERELALGAVAEGGEVVLLPQRPGRPSTSGTSGSPDALAAAVVSRLADVHSRVVKFRGDELPVDVGDKAVILVDDGVATGATALAAIRSLRRRGAGHIVLAVPVGDASSLDALGHEADEVVCLLEPEAVGSIGLWYESFAEISDDEVIDILAGARARRSVASPPHAYGALHRLQVDAAGALVEAELVVPEGATGVVLVAQARGSGRGDPRDAFVASKLSIAGFATLSFDLFAPGEGRFGGANGARVRFDLRSLADRLVGLTDWAARQAWAHGLRVGYFASSTAGVAALLAANERPAIVGAVVVRSSRPDLVEEALPTLAAPTLLIVGAEDRRVLALNRDALTAMRCEKKLALIPGARDHFDEPGALDAVARHATSWFQGHLAARALRATG